MKKFTSTFFLVSILFLTTTAFAEGDMPNGGGFTGDIPNGGGKATLAENASVEILLPSLIVKIQESLRFLFG
jgi:hypothetical protein